MNRCVIILTGERDERKLSKNNGKNVKKHRW